MRRYIIISFSFHCSHVFHNNFEFQFYLEEAERRSVHNHIQLLSNVFEVYEITLRTDDDNFNFN